MAIELEERKVFGLTTLYTCLAAIIASAISITLYISALDKRESLLEQSQQYLMQNLKDYEARMDEREDDQNRRFATFQTSIHQQIWRMSERVQNLELHTTKRKNP